jgi:hypothetical protein
MSATITSLPNVISIVPIFRSGGFDAEATQNLGKAYDIACRSLHPKGDRPSYKKPLPRRLLKPRSAVSAIPTGLQR